MNILKSNTILCKKINVTVMTQFISKTIEVYSFQ